MERCLGHIERIFTVNLRAFTQRNDLSKMKGKKTVFRHRAGKYQHNRHVWDNVGTDAGDERKTISRYSDKTQRNVKTNTNPQQC